MIKAVIFDMYETLITLTEGEHYFGSDMARDAGIENEQFQKLWKPSMDNRSIGKITLEELLETILKENKCYSDELLQSIVKKRMDSREESFKYLHEEIVPMLQGLKEHGMKIGLISNCFSEEALVIKRSELFPYFDAVCLSFEEGIQKPDRAIFQRCVDRLKVDAEECLYVGDGGSHELEAAKDFGMRAVQAVWYLKEGRIQPCKRNPEFEQAERPLEIVKIAK